MCLTAIVFVLPVVFKMRLRRSEMGTPERALGVLIVLVGTSAGAVGCFQAIQAIAQKLENGDSQ